MLLAIKLKHFMIYGGSRSGKTFFLVRSVALRALKSADSRHLIVRYRFNSCKRAVLMDTFPKVMKLCFPDVTYKVDKTDFYVRFVNGAEIWFGGLDDKDRTEKILGNEYATIYLNECSEISNHSKDIVLTRLAQVCEQPDGNGGTKQLALRMFYDCNPPTKGHWSYKQFVKKIDPTTGKAIDYSNDYGHIKVNPGDNQDNLPEDYLKTLESLPPAKRKRFLEGEFGDENPNALFSDITIDKHRIMDASELPDMVKIVVAVDPSGASDDPNENNDAIGICVCALGVDGRGYLLEDCTVSMGPAVWGSVATQAYDRHEANTIVCEKNFGGEMCRFVLRAANPDIPVVMVNASKGKCVRAEPISSLYHNGKISHYGNYKELEDELLGFSTHGYIGEKSPNRADALIWGLTYLFPGITSEKEDDEVDIDDLLPTSFGW